MTLRIDVEGYGTIATATRWESVARLSAAGRYSFSMPASDPAAAWLTPLARVFCYWDSTLVGAGVVEYLTVSGSMLDVEGGDLSVELLNLAIRYFSATSAETIADELGALLPAGWSYVNAIAGASPTVMLNVWWDSLQNAINTLCEMAGYWWHVVGTTLTIADTYGALVAGLTPISLTRRIDGSNVAGVIIPFGAGDGGVSLTMQAANLTLPPPYVYYQLVMGGYTGYGIGRSDAEGFPAAKRRRRLDLKHVSPATNDDAGIIGAANTLTLAAMQYLKNNAAPITEYAVSVVWAGVVRPLDRVALTYADEALRVSETLVATEVRTQVTPDQLATVGMRLEASARRILSDDEVVGNALRASRITPVYQQLVGSDDSITLGVWVDKTATIAAATEGVFTFRFHFTTMQVLSVIARILVSAINEEGLVNAGAGVPTALEYRLNGTGAWSALGASVDLTSQLINPVTLHQLADQNDINIRGVLRTNYKAAIGTAVGSIPAIPNGTQVRLVAWTGTRNSYFPSGGGTFNSSRLYATAAGTVIMDIPLNAWVTITGAPTTLPATSGVTRLMWYPCTYLGQAGYVVLYHINASNQVANDGGPPFSTVDYSGMVTVTLQVRSSSQSK